MNKNDIKIGDKIVPFQKTTDGYASTTKWENSSFFKNKPLYLIVSILDDKYITARVENSSEGGETYFYEDFNLYVEPPIVKTDYKIGDRVVPHSKSQHTDDLENSQAWREAKQRNQPFLYVTAVQRHDDIDLILDSSQSATGDYFFFSDVTPYVEPNTITNCTIEAPYQFKIGDKVVPHNKTIGISWKDYKAIQAYSRFIKEGYIIVDALNYHSTTYGKIAVMAGATYFNAEDLTLYTEKTTTIMSKLDLKTQRIGIKGKSKLLIAFEDELKEIGFKFAIGHTDNSASLEGYSLAFGRFLGSLDKDQYSHFVASAPYDITYILPEEYVNAVADLKEAFKALIPPKPTFKKLAIGGKTIIVEKNRASISMYSLSRREVETVHAMFLSKPLGIHSFYPTRIQLGCLTDGVEVNVTDIETVLAIMNDLN